jgi:hypothetical protein
MRIFSALVFAGLIAAPGAAFAQSNWGWDAPHRDRQGQPPSYEGHDSPHPGQHFDSWTGHYVDNDGFQPGDANGS